jgi:heme/copper-type cytochrome/quinol oxidase subunit 4
MLIVINLFLLVKEVIEFLMFLFYREEEDKEMDVGKPVVMYVLSVIVLCKLILVSWRHYQNKICMYWGYEFS